MSHDAPPGATFQMARVRPERRSNFQRARSSGERLGTAFHRMGTFVSLTTSVGKQSYQDHEIRRVLAFLARNWRILLISPLIGLVLGISLFSALPPAFTATTTLVLNNQRPRAPLDQIPATNEEGYVATQAAIIQSDLILKRIVDDLNLTADPDFSLRPRLLARLRGVIGLEPDLESLGPQDLQFLRERTSLARLRRAVGVRRLGTTFVVDVAVTTSDPEKSARIANAIAAHFIEDQRRYAVRITERANADSGVRVVSEATRPLQRSGPNLVVIAAASLIAGLAAGIAFAFLRELLRRGLRNCRSVEEQTGLDCLGVVPAVAPARGGAGASRRASGSAAAARLSAEAGLLSHAAEHPTSDFAQPFHLILSLAGERSNGGRPIVIGFVSPARGVGQSSVAANCATLAAALGRRALLVDADAGAGGLSDALLPPPERRTPGAGGASKPLVFADGPAPLAFLPADGRSTIGSDWLDGLKGDGAYDCIFVDLPPAAASGVVRTLSAALDGVVVVARWGETTAGQVRETLRALKDQERKVVGVVLNRG